MKRILALTLTLVTLISMFAGCSNTKTSGSTTTPPTKATEATQPTTEPTQPPTEPASTYEAGNWTTSGYTSEWLNMSYKRPLFLSTSDDSIGIAKQFDELKLKEDPHYAVTEMQFKRSTDTSNNICLYVKKLETPYKTAKQYAAEALKEEQDLYKQFGGNYTLIFQKEAQINFLGEEYYVLYLKDQALGKERQDCWLYLVKDGYLVKLVYTELSSYFILGNAFDDFSALNGEDHKTTCQNCSIDVNYEIISADAPMCLECYFDGE